MKKMNYPADYAVLSNEEMTYTTGGGAVDDAASLATTAATVVGAVVLASSYIWGIKQARTWLQQDGNKDGNFFTVMGRATVPLPPIWANPPATLCGMPFPPSWWWHWLP